MNNLPFTISELEEQMAFHQKQADILELAKIAQLRYVDSLLTADRYKRAGLHNYVKCELDAEKYLRIYKRVLKWYYNRATNQTSYETRTESTAQCTGTIYHHTGGMGHIDIQYFGRA